MAEIMQLMVFQCMCLWVSDNGLHAISHFLCNTYVCKFNAVGFPRSFLLSEDSILSGHATVGKTKNVSLCILAQA